MLKYYLTLVLLYKAYFMFAQEDSTHICKHGCLGGECTIFFPDDCCKTTKVWESLLSLSTSKCAWRITHIKQADARASPKTHQICISKSQSPENFSSKHITCLRGTVSLENVCFPHWKTGMIHTLQMRKPRLRKVKKLKTMVKSKRHSQTAEQKD
jgi:hypothetical protein